MALSFERRHLPGLMGFHKRLSRRKQMVTLFTATASATVANSVAETSIIGTGVGSPGRTLPANFLIVGRNIFLRLRGFIAYTLTPTVRVKVKYGSTIILDTTAITTLTLTGTSFFRIEADITTRTLGAAGTVFGQGMCQQGQPAAAAGLTEIDAAGLGLFNTAVTTVDTTVAQLIDVTFQWGTADPANTVTITDVIIGFDN